MKKFLIGLMIAVSAMSILAPAAQAKRMGGGGSIGRQSQSISRGTAPQHNQAAPMQQQGAQPAGQAAAQASKPASPWKGMLGGALLGLGLGALLSHFGLGGAMASMIGSLLTIALIALAAIFLFRLLRRKSGEQGMRPAFASASGYDGGPAQRTATPEIGSRLDDAGNRPASSGPGAVNDSSFGVPAGFDTEGFLRQSKTYFIRLQAAWDKSDLNDLREFTTPEMFAELRLELQERGASPNHTDVVSLDAQLLGIETAGRDYMASVKFSGMIREAENAPAEPFTEVWNLVKPVDGAGGWVLAGIQQLN